MEGQKLTSPIHVMQIAHRIMMMGKKMDGLSHLSKTCVAGSTREYVMKKTVRVRLYWRTMSTSTSRGKN